MKTQNYIHIATLIAGALLFSCKKEQAPPPPIPNGTVGLHIHTTVNGTELDSGATAADMNGRKIKLNIAQFYFSNVKLKKADGSEVAVSGVQLKTIGQETFLLGQVPAGNYSGLSFQVGLDNATNQTMPTSCASSSVLAPQNPAMWFGNCAQGYMFMNVQGYVDTTAAMNGNADQPFCVQLGTASMLKTITMPAKPYSIVANQTYFIHAMADYGMLLQDVNFKAHNMISPFNNATAAAQVADNVSTMFMFE